MDTFEEVMAKVRALSPPEPPAVPLERARVSGMTLEISKLHWPCKLCWIADSEGNLYGYGRGNTEREAADDALAQCLDQRPDLGPVAAQLVLSADPPLA